MRWRSPSVTRTPTARSGSPLLEARDRPVEIIVCSDQEQDVSRENLKIRWRRNQRPSVPDDDGNRDVVRVESQLAKRLLIGFGVRQNQEALRGPCRQKSGELSSLGDP